MKNEDVREKIANAGVRMWKVAEALGVADTTLSKKLRKELSEDEKRKIFSIVEQLAREVV